jgi:hypothetical protein
MKSITHKPKVVRLQKALPRDTKLVEALAMSQMELFKIRHPRLAKQKVEHLPEWSRFLTELKGKDRWIYWPDEKIAVHMLMEELYFELRTARNKNLINLEEQRAYRDTVVGIAGLSVGSSILSALVTSGGPKTIKLADFDVLEPTNLNRIRGGLADLGLRKIDIAAREVWKLDPFAGLRLYPQGLTETSLTEFILGEPRLDIFIDEMDNLALKVAARVLAKRKRIPVIMATDNGDGILLDVERFDLEPKRPLFHGLIKNLTVREARQATGAKWVAMVEKLIGGPWMPPRHKASLGELGKTLAGVPQLGTDAMTAGALVSLAVRKIAHGDALKSGRYIIDMNRILAKS